jgi:hypothetical protein
MYLTFIVLNADNNNTNISGHSLYFKPKISFNKDIATYKGNASAYISIKSNRIFILRLSLYLRSIIYKVT